LRENTMIAALLLACISSSDPIDVVSGADDTASPPPPDAMNIALVTVATLRCDHTSMGAYDRDTTPNLAAFAAQSVVFEHAYSHAPWTKPSFASTLTSTEPSVHHLQQWEDAYDADLESLTEVLRRNGYHTAAYITSYALRADENEFNRGFDVYDSTAIDGQDSHVAITGVAVTDLTLASLDELEEPWFVWIHYTDPHNDYMPQPDHVFGKESVDLYDGEIAYEDDSLGRVFDAFDRDDTITVFHSDHGEEFLDHGGTEHTKTLYDELVHVPFAE